MYEITPQPHFTTAPDVNRVFGDSAIFADTGRGYFIPFSDEAQSTAQTESGQGLSGRFGEKSGLNLSPRAARRLERKLATIEALIDTNDYVGAAEELLKINADDVPQKLMARYKDSLGDTGYALSGKQTYLNAQLKSQSIAVSAVEQERAQTQERQEQARRHPPGYHADLEYGL